MKKLFITLTIITSSIFTACSDNSDTENVSKLTTYPIITLAGADPALVRVGTAYTDPGAVGTVGGTPVPLTTRFVGRYRKNVSTTLDTNVSDVYNLEYTATNSDGFKRTAKRQVIVARTGDLVNSIEGLYTSTVARNGITPSPAYINIKYILIWKNANGDYEVSDAFGGWYLFGRAIADSETPGGTIRAVNIPANSFTFPGNPLTNRYFGGTANITGLTVNPVTKTLVLTCSWVSGTSNFNFQSTLTQVPL